MTACRFPLTLSQKDIFFDQLTQLESPIYNIGGYIACKDIEITRLQEAHRKLADNHDAFGLRIVEQKDDVAQYISSERDTSLILKNFSTYESPKKEANEWLDKLFQKTISFFDSQLCFGYLLQVDSNEFWYVGIGHHLAIDGWGFLNWSYKLAEYYNDLQPCEYEGLTFSEMSQADLEYLNSKRFQQDRAYWEKQNILSEQRLFSAQYYTKNEKGTQKTTSSRFIRPICRKWFEDCSKLCAQHKAGIPQFLIAALSYYFTRVQDLNHIVLGVPAHNRKNYKQKKTIGVFTTMTPLSIELQDDDTFASLLGRIIAYQRMCFRHQKFPNSDMARLFKTDEPFYDLSFNYLKFDYNALCFDQCNANVIYKTSGHERTPLTVTVWDGGDEDLELQLDFNHAFFSERDIQQLGERFDFLLKFFTNEQHWSLLLAQNPLIHPGEERELAILRGSESEPLSGLLIHEFVEKTATRVPNAVALTDAKSSITYRELNKAANRLAHYLLAVSEVDKCKIIGICQSRSIDMVVSVLAVLKAGMAYLPLDPKYPKQRLQVILTDAQPSLILCHSKTSQLTDSFNYPKCDVTDIHTSQANNFDQYSFRNLSRKATKQSAEKLAYLIYTSGSTGKPKGVAIAHQNASAMIDWAVNTFSTTELASVLLSTSLNFDLSVFEMFAPLAVGGSGVIVENALDLNYISKNVTLINTVPSVMKGLLAANSVPESVQVINLAGEPLARAIVNDIFDKTLTKKVFNLYGPSEDTTYSTYAEFNGPIDKEPHIGKILPHSQAYILNSHYQVVPKGTVGELYLSGAGVASGYFNNEKLTSERFISPRFFSTQLIEQHGKAYRTGDLVRLNEQGDLEYIGRMDDQVKIRGHRIELLEVQTHLKAISAINSCLVVAKKIAGELQLIAYCQPQNSASAPQISSSEIKASLALTLPNFMIPSFFVWLADWPLTSNGKIDKSKLPLPQNASEAKRVLLPETETEYKLVRIWAQLLESEPSKVSADADFFELGGHSILAMRLASSISDIFSADLGVSAVFTNSKLKDLAAYIDTRIKNISGPKVVPVTNGQMQFAASSSQQRLWLLDRMKDGSQEYNMAKAFNVSGRLELSVFNDTIATLVARHTSLRTTFKEVNNEVVQIITPVEEIAFSTSEIDLSEQSSIQQQNSVNEIVADLDNARFDLASDLMIRVAFLKLSRNSGVLHFNIHHIAADGWSIEIFVKEMVKIYTAKIAKLPLKLAPLPLKYTDFSEWQRKNLNSAGMEQQLDYWLTHLADMPVEHGLPTLKMLKQNSDRKAGRVSVSLSNERVDAIMQLARDKKLTPFMLIHSALALVLARYSNSDDIVIGTPVSERAQKELNNVIGFFVNTLILRVQAGESTVDEFLNHVKMTSLSAHENKDLPFEYLVEKLGIGRAQSQSPLFQIMLTTNNDYGVDNDQSLQSFSLGDIALTPLKRTGRKIKSPLEIEVTISAEGIAITGDYDHEIFAKHIIQSICEDVLNVLNELVEKKHNLGSLLTHQLDIISHTHSQHLLSIASECSLTVGDDDHVFCHFLRQVKSRPDEPAVHYGDESVTYIELFERAQKLAAYIQRVHGVKPGCLVAVYADRSIEMVVAMLAVTSARAAFIPIDVNYPQSRVDAIISDSNPNIILVTKNLTSSLPAGFNHAILEDVESSETFNEEYAGSGINFSLDDLAYVIYTSGTTGKPKGVMVSHLGLANVVKHGLDLFELKSGQRFYQATAFGFDAAIWVIAMPLVCGAAVQLASSVDFESELASNPTVSHVLMTPSALENIDPNKVSGVSCVMVGGEACSSELGQRWIESGKRFFNGYGPTETSICCTVDEALQGTELTIGRPISNMQSLVLNRHHKLAPMGCVGELCIAGLGVAKGYLNRHKLTAQRFIQNSYLERFAGLLSSDKIYKTGDKVRYLPDGKLEFLGRLDDQVKIRGFRVELEEIQAHILKHQHFNACVVVLKKIDDRQLLIAYCQLDDEITDSDTAFAELQRKLKATLPEYMVPSAFVRITELPLTSNGKVDKSALPLPSLSMSLEEFVAPETETEILITDICANLLNLPVNEISASSNFFELGGHSLMLLKLKSKIEVHFSLSLTFRDVADEATIQGISSLIDMKLMLSELDNCSQISIDNVEVMDW